MQSIKAEKREVFGKGLANSRKEGKLPIAVYGPKQDSESLFVAKDEFKKLWSEAGESTIVSVKKPDGEVDVLIHEVDFDPVSGEPVHADFYALDTSKPVEVSVPLEFEGVSPAVKNLGGILVKVMHELEIRVSPKELPHNLTVDLGMLAELDSQVKAKDIKLPESAELMVEDEEVVASIAVAKEEEEESVEFDPDAVEVEGKGKEDNSAEEGEEKSE